MASLPPRPESPPRDRDDRRYPPARHSVRPMAPQTRYRGERSVDSYQPPPPRERPEYDTYIAPSYDNRRPEYIGPSERDRDRDNWERDKDRDRGNERDRTRDWRGWDRDRDSRERSRRWEPGLDRRGYDRDRGFDNRRDTRPYNPSLSRRLGSPSRRMSRSPRGRRLPSPTPSHRARSRSPPYQPSLQPKKIKLGNHSITNSPRSRSRSPIVAQIRAQDRNLTNLERTEATIVEDEKLAVSHVPQSSLVQSLVQSHIKHELSSDTSKKSRSESPAHVPSTYVNKQENDDNPKIQSLVTSESGPKFGDQDRSVSPQKQPRLVNNPPLRVALPRQRKSRSPPRGPRNHPRTSTQLQTIPQYPSQYPTGPRGARRGHPPINSPAPSLSLTPTLYVDTTIATPIQESPQNAVRLPTIPEYKRKPLTTDLDQEISRLEAHRAHLTSEYTQKSKSNRRAVHELDIATIDLRAAEGRRKVADAQLEKAKNGLLGIDFVCDLISL